MLKNIRAVSLYKRKLVGFRSTVVSLPVVKRKLVGFTATVDSLPFVKGKITNPVH